MRNLISIGVICLLPLSSISQDSLKKINSLGLTASIPWVNNYSFYDYDSEKASYKSGFVGLGAAIFYKTDKNKISLNTGITAGLPVPIGAFDYSEESTRSSIVSIFMEGLYHRKIFKRVNLIGGVNYVNYKFNFISYVDSVPSYNKNDKTFGLSLGAEYLFSKNFSVALFYRPALISFNTKQYRHLISLDARFDINLWKK